MYIMCIYYRESSSTMRNPAAWTWSPVLVLLISSFTYCQNPSSYKLVQVLSRHGERTPLAPFPTDKWKDSWPEGLGQLTKRGEHQSYELGKFLRRRYNGFIDGYNSNEIKIKSSDTDRTLMSAYSNLAGLFPPTDEEKFNPDIDWQPIPVHTMPEKDDYILSDKSFCPKKDALFDRMLASSLVTELFVQNEEVIKSLSLYTGQAITPISLSDVQETLLIEQMHGKCLPDWVNETVLELMEQNNQNTYWALFMTEEQRKLQTGPLLKELVQNMQNKADGKLKTKVVLNVSHDLILAGLLFAFDAYNNIVPPSSSAILIELLDDGGDFSVQILYRNSTTKDPIELYLKNCTSPCPFDEFKAIVKPLIPTDIRKECGAML